MISRVSIFLTISMLLVLVQLQAAQNVSPSTFVGTWVGVQTWAIENPSPSAVQEQPVTLTIELVDGKLVGKMDPFFGGSDGASFVDAQIVGDQLQASAIIGQPQPAGQRGGQPPRGWKATTKILLNLRSDGNKLHGTADITLGDVKWLKLNYELGKKRSRY